MPWKSSSQRGYFYAHPELHKYIAEFNAATPKGAVLPKHVAKGRSMAQKKKRSNFDKLASQLANKPGITNPKGLAYTIGARKFGKSTMARAASEGRPAARVE